MKDKFVIVGIILCGIALVINSYFINYYCEIDDYCLYKVGDGLTENILYLALTFLVASLISLIAQKRKWWLGIFLLLSVATFYSSQTCDMVGCFNRDALLIVTSIVTILIALITNIFAKYKK